MFNVCTGPHGNPSIVLNDATKEQVAFLKRAVLDTYMNSEFYRRSTGVRPFLQGGSDNTEGYFYVEFWCSVEKANAYVAWLNSVYEDTVREMREFGMFNR